MVATRFIRELTLASPPNGDNHARHISAASGMVVVGAFLYVVADDELHLGVFDISGAEAGDLVRLFPGDLPGPSAERKALKPDLEALVRLPSYPGYPHGALLALASGSKPNRRTGVVLELDESGRVAGEPCPCDPTPLYSSLESRFPALNIESSGTLIASTRAQMTRTILAMKKSRKMPNIASMRPRLQEEGVPSLEVA